IRALAGDLNRGGAVTPPKRRDQAERLHGAAGEKDKAALYRALEAQIRERDQARAERRARDRDNGGRGDAPARTPAPGAPENRAVARDLERGEPARKAARRDQAERLHGAAGEKDKGALYRELEAQIRERDLARAKHGARHRDDGGRGL